MSSGHHHAHAQEHEHKHRHGQHDGHEHALPENIGRAFFVGIFLNAFFVVAEVFYGWQAHSLALLSDAGHNLGDVGGLVLAWAALLVGKRKPDVNYTYGWRRASILAGFANAVLLLVAMGSLMWEAVQRLRVPESVDAHTVIAVAAVGVMVNGITALLFMRSSHGDINIRGAFLHMAGDALVSLGVVIAGVFYLWRGWGWIDPVVSLIVGAFIIYGSFSLLKQALHLMFDGVPADVDLHEVRTCLQQIAGVNSVHDLHVWALGSNENALTAHLVVDDVQNHALLLAEVREELHEHFAIDHITVQVEDADSAASCFQASHVLCGVG